ncbi:MAG: TIGR00153 family protein [Paracoccaceae bacterium]|nr:TIGR00153 family protein [Paracoccaceae bacterium]
MARSIPFATLFGKSPFKPMQEHMRTVKKCAAQVTKLFEALCEGDQEKIGAIKDRIFELESEADDIKNELRAHLPKSLFMPVDRRDLLELLDLQDSIADTAQDIAGLLFERKMEVLDGMEQPLMNLVRRCVEACNQASRIIECLDELVETGFRGRDSDTVIEMVEQLNKIESDTDQMGIELARSLFIHEDQMKPVSVVFWYDLITMIGDLADYAEKVGNRLRLLLAR